MGCGSSIMGGGITGGLRNITGLEDYRKGMDVAAQRSEQGAGLVKEYTGKAVAGLDPYAGVGTEALDMYRNMVLGGNQEAFRTSPGYQFRLGEGIKSRENIAAARGGLLSGAQLKGIESYAQGMASDEYGNYLGQVGNLMGQGFDAASTQGQYYAGAGGQLGNIYGQLGQTGAEMWAGRGRQKMELIGMGAEAAGSAMGASDEKVKENIEYTGEETEDGIKIITFNYKEGYGFNTSKRYKGVIAQEVEKIIPEAVSEIDGIKRVDYSILGIEMEEV